MWKSGQKKKHSQRDGWQRNQWLIRKNQWEKQFLVYGNKITSLKGL